MARVMVKGSFASTRPSHRAAVGPGVFLRGASIQRVVQGSNDRSLSALTSVLACLVTVLVSGFPFVRHAGEATRG